MTQVIPGRTKIVTGKTNSICSTDSVIDRLINNYPFMPDVPFHLNPLLKNPTQQPIKQNIHEINSKINFDFEENSPFQEGIMSETSKDQTNHFSRTQRSWGTL